VEEAVTTVLPLLERGGTEFIRNYYAEPGSSGLGLVRLDRMKVRQVLLNLLGNATKFTAGGQIELAVWREVEADGEERVVLRVSDTGIGMSPEQIKRIFEEFAQGSAATTRQYGGTGLGLAISRSFCQRMRGDIEVASSLGEGSTFTVRLPAALDDAEAAGGEAEALGDDPRAAEAPLDLEEAPDDASTSMRSGVFPWPV
jgi:signal transduction histidine kinase